MSLKDFQIITRLGEGAYSSVYKVKRIIDGNQYALKKVKLGNLTDKQKQNALNEVRILASINHQNIIGYKQAFIDQTSNCLFIIMEYADNGDLYQKITQYQKKNINFSENQIWSIFIQVTRGLKALHQLKILHRDLKSANVFLTKEGIAKLGDMNVSKVSKGMCQTQTGTPYYASPQVWKDQPYDKKSDIWSLGCVLYETITLKPPFRAEDMEGLYKKVIRGFYPRIPSEYSNDLSNIIKVLLQVTPHLRPSTEKILEFPTVIKRMDTVPNIANNQIVQTNHILLNTIRIPKNIKSLTERLPKSNYTSPSTLDLGQKLEKKKKKKVKEQSFLPSIDYNSANPSRQPNRKNTQNIRYQQPIQKLPVRMSLDPSNRDKIQTEVVNQSSHIRRKKKRTADVLPSLPIIKGNEVLLSIDSRKKKSIVDLYIQKSNRIHNLIKY